MLVHGGRPEWARVVSFASIPSVLLALGVGCGSRTSMLDVDAYASEGLGGFGHTGGSSNAQGASTGDPNAVDPQRSASACESYCKGYKVKCAAELSGRDCLATCAAEVNGKGKACQSVGIDLLECLAPFLSSSSRSKTCKAAQDDGSAACQGKLGKFAQCAAPSSVPMPRPDRPGKTGLVDTCASAISSEPDTCIRMYSCMDGAYLVECVSQLDGKFSCSCSFPSGMMQGAIYAPVADPCLAAGTDCGFY